MILVFDGIFIVFLAYGEFSDFHSKLYRFVSESYWKHQVSSPVTTDFKEFGSFSVAEMMFLQCALLIAFCSGDNVCGTNLAHTFVLPKFSGRMVQIVSLVRGFYLEKTVSKDTSVTEIEIKLKKIEQLQINLDKIPEDYCEIEIFESLEIIQLDIEDINQRIETTEVGLKLLMYSLKNSENVNINLNDNGKNSIRLPQIPLPEFSGVIAEFSNFKNPFINLISNNEQLNDSQKLYYLRASLKGEAKLLESPSDSFDSLFKALEDRYENKRQLIDSHVLEIINYEKNL
ncbi:integrase catalytic domain-containing protein [Trichonephila clavipes]|nr:integrase catalytic domain-containing protein [Trichonephila clavipes]